MDVFKRVMRLLGGLGARSISVVLGLLLLSSFGHAMEVLDDQTLSNTTGQAAYFTDYTGPSGSGTGANATDFGFYKVGFNATLNLNANIKSLQLGCGGVNGPGCDIDGQNVSFGCAADGAGNCITSSTSTQATQLKDFTLTNPFLQLAIKNPTVLSKREVVGFRLGAGNVSGPLSFGNLSSFSGYLSATANLSLQGADNVAVTCKYPATCVAPGANTNGMYNNGASSWGAPSTSCGFFCTKAGQGTPSGGYLNLGDDMILDIGIAKIRFQEALVGYQTVDRNGLPVVVNGNRQTQASIQGGNLGGVVNSLVYGNTDGSTSVGANPLQLQDSDSGFLVSLFGSALLPALRGGIADQIKRQLASGLRIYNPNQATNQTTINSKTAAQINTDLNGYNIPYNISNMHQIDVNSPLFGLSLQNQSIQYPGYIAPVTRGWAMYLPNAFQLNVARPTTDFVSNITGSSAARDGNIVSLPASYLNCYGSLKFC